MAQSVVVITGALTGIGEATAKAFAQHGDIVVISGLHDDVGAGLAQDLKAVGAADAVFVRADVRSGPEPAHLIDTTITSLGCFDIAVNNAGTEGIMAPVTEVTEAQYTDVFNTNVLGTTVSMKHEMRVMQPQGSGAIINVTSIYGNKGFPNAALYVASKHAVIGLTRSVALEAAAFGVRVNAIGPGLHRHGDVRSRRGQPREPDRPVRHHPAGPRRTPGGGRRGDPIPLGRPVLLPERPDAVPPRRRHGGISMMTVRSQTPFCPQSYSDDVANHVDVGQR